MSFSWELLAFSLPNFQSRCVAKYVVGKAFLPTSYLSTETEMTVDMAFAETYTPLNKIDVVDTKR